MFTLFFKIHGLKKPGQLTAWKLNLRCIYMVKKFSCKLLMAGVLFWTGTGLAFAQTKVQFYTSMGDFVVTLNDTLAPLTSGNFKSLVESRFYDGITFHRVIDDFMIQGGDPTGTGDGGSETIIEDEFHVDLSNLRQTISMANDGPNTGTSQFFINLVDNTYLDFNKQPLTSKHPVFGEVTENFHIVQLIGSVPVDNNDKPFVEVTMDSLRLIEPTISIYQNVREAQNGFIFYSNMLTPKNELYFISNRAGSFTVQVYDESGKLRETILKEIEKGEHSLVFMNNYPKGVYLLQINHNHTSQTKKVIKI